MARRPLEIGEWGRVKRIRTPQGPAARAYFRDGRGIRVPVQRRGPSPAQAEDILVKALKEMAKLATGDGAITAESTIDELWDYYLAELVDEDRKDGTITTYRSIYSRHIQDQLGRVKLRQVTVARLEQIIRAQKEHPSTAKGVRVVLVNMFDVAVRHDAVKVNLAKNTKPVTIPRKRVKALQPDQVKRMLTLFELASRVRNRDLDVPLKLLSVTGCRTGELLAVRWEDLDLTSPKGILRVTGTIVQDAETGRLKRQDEGKSLAAERGLTLPSTVTRLLVERHRLSDTEAVFPSREGGYQWPNNFRRKWRSVTDDTNFEGTTPRDFRKAVATYLDRKVGSQGARDQLGHESEDITTEYYIEREEEIADFADFLEELVS